MATSHNLAVFDAAGVPLTTATPTAFKFLDKTGAARPVNPTFTHIGSGLFEYSISDADYSVGSVLLIDAGATAQPRYTVRTFHQEGAPFFAFHLEDGVGVLWTGIAPTVFTYRDSTGALRTPPAFISPYTYLHILVPTGADIALKVRALVQGPIGSSVGYLQLYTTVELGTGVAGAGSPMTYVVTQPDEGTLVLTFPVGIVETTALYDPLSYGILPPAGSEYPEVTEVTKLNLYTIRLAVTGQFKVGGTYTMFLPPGLTYSSFDLGANVTTGVTWAGVGVGTSVANFIPVSAHSILIRFSRAMDPTSLASLASYTLAAGAVDLTVTGVLVVSEREVVLSEVETQVPTTLYDGFATTAKDKGGNTASSSITTFLGYGGDMTLITSVTVVDGHTLLVVLSRSVRVNPQFYDPSHWAIKVRQGYANPVYATRIEQADPGTTTLRAYVHLHDFLSNGGRYALRVADMSDTVNEAVNTPDFAFNT